MPDSPDVQARDGAVEALVRWEMERLQSPEWGKILETRDNLDEVLRAEYTDALAALSAAGYVVLKRYEMEDRMRHEFSFAAEEKGYRYPAHSVERGSWFLVQRGIEALGPAVRARLSSEEVSGG